VKAVSNATPLKRVASTQYGLATREQLAARVPTRTITSWAKNGRLVPLQSGVFRVAGTPDSWEQRCLAAVLAGGDGCLAGRRAAAYLWGYADRGEIEVVVGRKRLPRLDGAIVHRSRDLDKFAPATRLGIPVTGPALTLLDLAAADSIGAVTKQVDRAIVEGHLSLPELIEAIDLVARPGRQGVRTLRDAVQAYAVGSSEADSVLEVRFLRLVERSGLPKPRIQYEIRHDGVLVARVDFFFPGVRLIVELDGLGAHRTATALQRDLERQNRLVGLGFTVLRFTWHDVVNRPDYVVESIKRALGTKMAK
jgi:very-short-patch-repair endonuclease